MMHRKNKAVFITGAASGLGEATAERLAADGYDLALVDLNAEALRVVAERLRSQGAKVWFAALDVSDENQVQSVFQNAVEEHSRLWAAVNVAGIGIPSAFSDLTTAMWNKTFAVNVTGTFLVCQAAAAHFGDQGGRIVNVTSIAAQQGSPLLIDYSASKGAVSSFTKALARVLAPKGVNVNAVAPGYIRTNMWRAGEERMEAESAGESIFDATVARAVPLGRPQTGGDVAGAIAYLVSDDAHNVTGQTMNVDGGTVMR